MEVGSYADDVTFLETKMVIYPSIDSILLDSISGYFKRFKHLKLDEITVYSPSGDYQKSREPACTRSECVLTVMLRSGVKSSKLSI